jgi:hypothetical protein
LNEVVLAFASRLVCQCVSLALQADLNEVVLAFGFAPQTLRVW